MTTPDYAMRNKAFNDSIVALDGSILTVTLNRAKQRNTFTEDLVKELIEVFTLADRDDRVRAVILTAEHTAPAYCSGADISGGWNRLWEPEAEKEGEHAHRDGGGTLSLAILNCRKITIAAVNGHAAGVGMTALQLPFDFRFVWEGAKLTFPFVRRGIVPEAVSTYLLPRLVGHSRASSLFLSGEVVSPNSPHINSLYHKILPNREDVYPAAKAFAQELALNTAQVSVAYTKGLMQHPGKNAEENHLLDSRAMKLLASSHDGTDGVQAFLEKRMPKFTDTLSKNSSPWYPWWRRLDVKHYKSKL
ncbi:peroxisomal enoyl-CoA-hydratase [Ephemerocybe angulata]|uniref:Peroxisomal enoyl-CoA-hydratase n=1 Tax=Ephemerocybe angulata TaxID=980116 RepID=A0A8H6M736_9AGAR|nr:peroxisomal enoyl-CoA-hydratase [Tulosesus angulatus]